MVASGAPAIADSVGVAAVSSGIQGSLKTGLENRIGRTLKDNAAERPARSLHPPGLVYRPMRMATAINVPRPAPEAEELYRRWLQFLDDEFVRHSSRERRAEIVRDQLYQLYLGRPHGGKLNLTLTSELPGNILGFCLDSANITLEAEYFSDIDRER